MTARRTLAEIASTCAKATRAAGCPWGMAEEAGLAARRLAAHGLPAAEAVSGLLTTPRRCPCHGAPDGPGCALSRMVGMMDAPPGGEVRTGPVAAPLLLLGFALADGPAGAGWTLRWSGGTARCRAGALALDGGLPGPVADVTVIPGAGDGGIYPPDWRSRRVDAAAWKVLTRLASQLLVPETAQSRAAGAGPGQQDDR